MSVFWRRVAGLVPGRCSSSGVCGLRPPIPAGVLCLSKLALDPPANGVPILERGLCCCCCCSARVESGPLQLLLPSIPRLEGRCMTMSWSGMLAVPGRTPATDAGLSVDARGGRAVGALVEAAAVCDVAVAADLVASSSCNRADNCCSFLANCCCNAVRSAGARVRR